MKKFKTVLPTICYTALLLIIALLSFLIVGKSGSPATSAEQLLVDDQPSGQPIETVPTPEKTVKTVYTDVFPRKSSEKRQVIYGEGNIGLCDVLQTPVGNYILLSSDCTVGDLSSDAPCLAIVKTDKDNDLVDSVIIATEENFVTAHFSAVGIVLVTNQSSQNRTVIRIIDYSLRDQSEYTLTMATSARVVPTESGFFVFTGYDDSCVVYNFTGEKMLFQKIDKVSMVDLFEYEEYYLLFCNLPQKGFCSLRVNKTDLSVTEKTYFGDNELICILPVIGGKNFLTIEKNSTYIARRYDEKGKLSLEKDLGNLHVREIFFTGGITLLCEAPFCGYITVTGELITSFEEITTAAGKEIISMLYTETERFYLLKDANDIIYSPENEPIDRGTKAILLLTPDQTKMLYLQKISDYGETYIEIYPI